ncbi:MAG TPA: oligoendopeptidase F [Chloroflexota bacterium]
MARALPPRSEIPIERTWDVQSVFATDEAWRDELARVSEALPNLEAFSGRLAEGPEVLADCMDVVIDLWKRAGKVSIYANMLYAVDTANGDAKAKSDQAGALFARVGAAAAFIDPELLAIGIPTLRTWISQEPRLSEYGHYLDELERRQAHVRSSEVEEILGLVRDPFGSASDTHSILVDTDLTFALARSSTGEQIEPAQGNIDALLSDPDREVRRTAWESYSDAHLAVRHSIANALATGVKQHVFFARARHYDSALEASLSANNVPIDVYRRLIETYRKNLPTWHRYWRVRREALGYDKLHVYDILGPLTNASPKVSYEQAVDWVVEGMRPLGSAYVDALRRGATTERWVDVYPNLYKTSGAYSDGWPGTHPFILMSYTDDVLSMSTLAHEMGHSMQSYLTNRSQPFIYANYGLFVAEVASNFNQALVRAHLLRTNQDRDYRITLIEEAMSNFHRYFFIMPILAQFELELHERVERGEGLNADIMMAVMTDLFREGYGGEVEIDDQRIGITWAEFPTHLYMNFYVYQYATGIAAAHALAGRVLDQGQEAADRYLAFLRAGGSLFPLDALQLAGVDMTSPEPVDETFGVLASMVDELEELVRAEKPAGA